MSRTLIPVLALIYGSVWIAPAFAQDRIRNLVVKIHAIHHTPDVLRPWTKNSPQHVGGSGVVIAGNRILTNAHVVRYASQVYVQPNQSPDRIPAQIAAIAPSIDLAVLKLENEKFFEGRGFLPFASELPRVKDVVNVYGYPTGGSELSVTQGIVSRIEFTDYYYQTSGLRIQVDAALNFGNSGGPAVSEGKLIGLVFSLIQNAQNIGYLIPVEEIELFLADVADGHYDGKPRLREFLQTVENPALRRKLGLPPGTSGVMVADPYRKDPSYPVREWDVITRIGGHPVEADGKVSIRYDLRLSALYLVQKYAKNGRLEVMLFRNGEFKSVELPVPSEKEMVLPYLMNRQPRFFIVGPLVFSQATQEYVERVGAQRLLPARGHPSPLITRRYDRPAFPGEELVVVSSPMFPHSLTNGYDDPERAVVSEINGLPVKSLVHLVEIIRDSRDREIIFKFSKAGRRTHETMVFDRAELLNATHKILEENGIRHPYSPDLRSVWEKAVAEAPRAAQVGCCAAR